MQTATLQVMEKNYRVHCAHTNTKVPEDFDIKQMVDSTLEEIEFDKMRARTMDMDDFLKYVECIGSDLLSP